MTSAREPQRAAKSDTAFRTIGELVQELDLPAHVLRFWESKFPQVKPLKRGGGRRYYRPEDVDLLRRIRHHLYQEGYTIRGVQNLLREGGLCSQAPQTGAAAPLKLGPAARSAENAARPNHTRMGLEKALREVRAELLEIRTLLDKLLE